MTQFSSVLRQYNEGINDLLSKAEMDAKHEIKHEKGRTTVTDAAVGEHASRPTGRRSRLTLGSARSSTRQPRASVHFIVQGKGSPSDGRDADE